jgi:Glutamine amidotransferase domain
MSVYDKDGLGYAAMGREGIWGERWLNPKDAWKYRKPWTEEDSKTHKYYKGALDAEPRFNDFGLVDITHTNTVMLHARMATCVKSLVNTHPFVRDNLALIHNGVIGNHKDLENLTSTCDSETILNSYFKHNIANKPEDIQKVMDDIRGYYACGVLSTNTEGKQHLDIFRNSTAQMSAYFVKELDAVVFCTRSEIIRETCKKLGWTYGNTFTFKDEVMVRIDCVTGQPVSTHKFLHKYGYVSRWTGNSAMGEATTIGETEKKSLPALTIVKGLRSQEKTEEQRAIKSQVGNGITSGTKDSVPMVTEEQMRDPFYYNADYARYLQ